MSAARRGSGEVPAIFFRGRVVLEILKTEES